MKWGKVQLIIQGILSLPKSIVFNAIAFPLKEAIKLPVLISWNTKLRHIYRGCVKINANIKPAIVRIGFGGTPALQTTRGELYFQGGTITFEGKATIAKGICIRNNGIIIFGRNFGANKNLRISCSEKITFGDDCLIGYNVSMRDSNGHTILCDGKEIPNSKPIVFGNHVWLCAESHVLGGAVLGNDVVLGYGSLLKGRIKEDGVIVAGNPASVIKEKVEWRL